MYYVSFPNTARRSSQIHNKAQPYFSAARKTPDAQSALNSGSHESRKYSSSFIIPRMLFPLTRAKLSSIARLRRRTEGQEIAQSRAIWSRSVRARLKTSGYLWRYLLMETSRSFRQSTMVLRCLWTALWSVCTVFSKDVSATYLKRGGDKGQGIITHIKIKNHNLILSE